jgi:hypothetical protein
MNNQLIHIPGQPKPIVKKQMCSFLTAVFVTLYKLPVSFKQ